jgi:3-hydroxyisobutyrate dehydrogenase-like beta-hydroxyacid dehydrogenase
MAWADTPRAVAEKSEIVFSIVTDGAAVRAVALGDDGVLAACERRHLCRHEHDLADVSRAVAAEFAKAGASCSTRRSPAVR